jgi:hypothetical protein
MENVVEFLKRFREESDRDRKIVSKDPVIESVLSMTLDEFGKQNLAILVRSHLLGENFYMVPNREALAKIGGEYVIYLPEELEAIAGLSPGGLKDIHRIKKLFDGEIISWSGS